MPEKMSAPWRIAIAIIIFIAVGVSLAYTSSDVGMSWDEGNDLKRAKLAAGWISLLGDKDAHPLSRNTIEAYWDSGWQGHPALTRIIHAVTAKLICGFSDSPVFVKWYAYRYGTYAVFAALAAAVFLFGSYRLGRIEYGLFSAAALAFMPRMFGHAHIVETDIILGAFCFGAAAAFIYGLENKWTSVAFGVFTGLLPAIKFTGLAALAPILIYGLLFERGKIIRNILCMIFISPIVFFLLQPMFWHQPLSALAEYIHHHLKLAGGVNITTCYFGINYPNSPPWTYPFAIIALSIPIASLVAAIVGALSVAAKNERRKFTIFLIMNSLFLPLLFIPGRVPSYDGERLFIASFPFIALLAGVGFRFVFQRFHMLVRIIALVLFIAYGTGALLDARPFYLSYYNEIVGGTAGAVDKGMEAIYWGDAFTPEFAASINKEFARLPYGTRLTTIGYFSENLRYFQELGFLDRKFEIVEYGNEADFLLLFNRRGVLDETSLYLLDHGMLFDNLVRKHGDTLMAGVYVLRPGYRLMIEHGFVKAQ
ncbi:MAG: hypothetical protein WCX65_07450 [bacterium]